MADERAALVQSFFQRYFGGHVSEALELLEPAVEYHVPGRGEPSGMFVGRDAVADHLSAFLELTERTIDILKWEDWLVGDTWIAALARVQLQRTGRASSFRLLFLAGVSSNRLIDRIEVFFRDPEVLERFFSW